MNFPKSILVIKYFPYYKNSEGPDYLPIGIISVENAKEFFIGENGYLYVVYAYGNESFTSETDVVIFR